MSEELRGLLETIYRAENGGRIDYNVVYSGIRAADRPSKPITQMTVNEVLAWQASIDHKYNSEAAGAPQVIEDTLRGLVNSGRIDGGAVFDPATQDRIAIELMRGRGLEEWQAGRLNTVDFGTNLAMEWASLPVLKTTYRNKQQINRGSAYYGGIGDNTSRAAVTPTAFEATLGAPGRTLVDPASFGARQSAGVSSPTTRYAQKPTNVVDPGIPYVQAEYRPAWDVPDVRLRDLDVPDQAWMEQQGIDMDFVLPEVDYGTRGPEAGPLSQKWGTAFMGEFTDSFIVRQFNKDRYASRYEWDPAFDPFDRLEADGLMAQYKHFTGARNAEHYEFLKKSLQVEALRQRRRELWDGTAAQTLGGLLNPDSLLTMFLPAGGVAASAIRGTASGVVRTGARTALFTTAAEIPLEMGRARLDPYSSELDSVMRVGTATLLSGLIGGGIGGVAATKMRRDLINQVEMSIALNKGVAKSTQEVDLGNGMKGVVIRNAEGRGVVGVPTGEIKSTSIGKGISIRGDKIVVDEIAIMKKFHEGKFSDEIKTPEEASEFSVQKAASMERLFRGAGKFWKDEEGSLRTGKDPFLRVKNDGSLEINKDKISKAFSKKKNVDLGPAKGSPADGRINPITMRAEVFDSADQLEAAMVSAHKAAARARGQAEFEDIMEVELRNLGVKRPDFRSKTMWQRQAEAEAHAALLKYREENNRILQNAKMELLSRLVDSPYKRIHRNSLAPETRDLVDKLAADGAFARGSDGKGLSVGPSVYSRAKTWRGVTWRLYDQETKLYEKYLGFEKNPEIGGVPIRKSLGSLRYKADGTRPIEVTEFRKRVSQAYITGTKDDIPEIMEMVENLRNAWEEYANIGKDFGVISTRETLDKRIKWLVKARDEHPSGSDEWVKLNDEIELVREGRKLAEEEPSEDYFSRVYNKRAISENREAFKEKVVKPWMVRAPFSDIWELGKDELERPIMHLRWEIKNYPSRATPEMVKRLKELQKRYDAAPERSRWKRVATSSDPALLEERADEFIRQILGEADPDDLNTMRSAHRPTFGRHRQFNMPNRYLLKSGAKGNGVADFIETDYMLVHQIYSERMAPAIEMARTFGSPVSGMDWESGFEEAIYLAKQKEKKAWKLGHPEEVRDLPDKKLDEAFAKHWDPIERDMRHLVDRVTNRVIKNPERWDNRAATVMRNWAQLAFMGSSALPAIGEIGTLVMRHGVSRVWQAAIGELDETVAAAGIREMKVAGGIMEVVDGAALSRFAETGMDSLGTSAPERLLRTASNKYFMWNGLAPLAHRLKELDAAVRVHDMVDRIDRVNMLGKGADEADLRELARYGISLEDAHRMALEPIERTDEGHWLANTDMWGDEDLVRKFRAAISQGNENTILMATAADKPTIMDGTVYIRAGGAADKYAERLGIERAGPYWKVQSGLMTLPFTFWNYAVAAHNKILTASLDEPSAQKMGGIAAMVGLGYMIAQVRTPDWQWATMDSDERILEGVKQSGIIGVLGNVAEIGSQDNIGRTALRAAGAGPSVASNALIGGVTGDVNQFSWALPFRNHFLLRDLFDAAVDNIERERVDVRR